MTRKMQYFSHVIRHNSLETTEIECVFHKKRRGDDECGGWTQDIENTVAMKVNEEEGLVTSK